jgi:hypothetical protein
VDLSFPRIREEYQRILEQKKIGPSGIPKPKIANEPELTIQNLWPIIEDLQSIDCTLFIPDHKNAANSDFQAKRAIAARKLWSLWHYCTRVKNPLFTFYVPKNLNLPITFLKKAENPPNEWEMVGEKHRLRPIARHFFLMMVRNYTGLQRILSMLILHVLNKDTDAKVYFQKDRTRFDVYFTNNPTKSSYFQPGTNRIVINEAIDFSRPELYDELSYTYRDNRPSLTPAQRYFARILQLDADKPNEKMILDLFTSPDIPETLLHECTHAYHAMVLGPSRLSNLSPVTNHVVLTDPIINYPRLFYPMLEEKYRAPFVEQLSQYIATLGDLSYLRERVIDIVSFLERQGMASLIPKTLTGSLPWKTPSLKLCNDIATLFYVYACCFDVKPKYNTETGKIHYFGHVGTEKADNIWTNPEEMLTIIGVAPLMKDDSSPVLIIDRQNENAFRRRDGRMTSLFHRKGLDAGVVYAFDLLLAKDPVAERQRLDRMLVDLNRGARGSQSPSSRSTEPELRKPTFTLSPLAFAPPYDIFPGLTKEMLDAGDLNWLYRMNFSALECNDLEPFLKICKQRDEDGHPSLLEKNAEFATPLHIAAKEGNRAAVEALLSRITSGNSEILLAKDRYGCYPAGVCSDVATLQILLQKMSECRLFDPNIAGALLHQQVKRGEAEFLQALLEFFKTNFSANFTEIINAGDEVRCTPLIKAAAYAYANPEKTRILLDHGADVMRQNPSGNTAIAGIVQGRTGLFDTKYILSGKWILEYAKRQGKLADLCRISGQYGKPLEAMMETLLVLVKENDYQTYLVEPESIEALKAFIALLIEGVGRDQGLLNAITIPVGKKILGTPLDAAYAYLGGVVAKIESTPEVDKINYFHFLDVGIFLVSQLSGAGAFVTSSQNHQLVTDTNSNTYRDRQRELASAQELLNSLLRRIPNS